jgi:hypothetical protein
MDNNAPNKPATTAHKVRMKHTYFAISFGGGSVIAVLPICLENILEKICEKKVDSSQKERLKRRRKDSRGGEPNLCGSQNPTLRAESVHDPSKRAPPDVLAA